MLEYYRLAQHLGPDQPFYALQSRGLNGEAPHKTIEEMATHYLKEIRQLQPEGPYLIGGRSLGGMIAYEMACQLRADGEEVALVALLDSYPVGYHKVSGNGTFGKAVLAFHEESARTPFEHPRSAIAREAFLRD